MHSPLSRTAAWDTSVGRTARAAGSKHEVHALVDLRVSLVDAGLKKTDIDGLMVVRIPGYIHFSEMLGLPQLRLVKCSKVAAVWLARHFNTRLWQLPPLSQ